MIAKEELTLGQKIKNFRQRANMSQFELEVHLDASPGSLSRIEGGHVNPTKETLLKIIEVLNIDPGDAAFLFNINLESELRKVIDVSLSLNESHNLNEMLSIITDKISIFAGGNAATIWFWDEMRKELKLEKVMANTRVTAFIERVLTLSSNQIVLSELNTETRRNHYMQCITNSKVVLSYDTYDLAYTILSRTVSSIINKWLNLRIAISLPLLYKDKKIGVFSIVWDKQEFTDKDLATLQAFTDQIAISIYNARKYDELEKKYLKLKNERSDIRTKN